MSRVKVHCVSAESRWDALAPEWRALHVASPSASPALDFDWLHAWWQVYGLTSRRTFTLRIICVERGGTLVGALPLYTSTGFGERKWSFLGTGGESFDEVLPAYLDLLHAPDDRDECIQAVTEFLSRRRDWEVLHLEDVPDSSPLLLAPVLQRLGAQVTSRYPCPRADLHEGFDAYIQNLSAKTRKNARQRLREAAAAGASLEIARTPESIDASFEILCALHQERWTSLGRPGCFSAPRFVEFHRRIARQWCADGRGVLAVLRVQEDPVAAVYGFLHRRKFDFYQGGIKASQGVLTSPGVTGHLLLMQRLVDEGVVAYDFLAGAADYKTRLATSEITVCTAVASRLSARTWATQVKRHAGRVVRAVMNRWRTAAAG